MWQIFRGRWQRNEVSRYSRNSSTLVPVCSAVAAYTVVKIWGNSFSGKDLGLLIFSLGTAESLNSARGQLVDNLTREDHEALAKATSYIGTSAGGLAIMWYLLHQK